MIVLHKMLTRLLLLDKPVPDSDEEALAEANTT